MTDLNAKARPKRITIEAVITRADGTVEPQGVIAHWDRNPLRRLWWRITRRA